MPDHSDRNVLRLIFTTITLASIFAFAFTPQELFAAKMETIDQMSDRIAISRDISTTSLSNLWHSESSGDPEAIGDHGCSLGLTQQNLCVNKKISREDALAPEISLAIAADDIAAGREDRYTVCNCYAFVSTKIRGLPRLADIVPNSSPHVGAVALFIYRDKETGAKVRHIAIIKKISASGFEVEETNFEKCLHDQRFITWGDPHLVGFWSNQDAAM